ncbi:Ig-like domain-containing protein [Actinoplanes sp. NPDC023714]|uniref:Ig-like domain-containing protein n=1 Tax=Actinoplanes sp. NPDC023714 TaxID=3154322 RepID=UPI0033D14BBC
MLRAAASAALASILLLTTPGPALADDPARDTTPPVILSSGLTEGQYIQPFHHVFPAWTDDVGVVGTEVYVNGEFAGAYGRTTAGVPAGQIWVKDAPDGAELRIGIRVHDKANNWSEILTTGVILDRTVPTATVLPDDELIVAGRSLTLVASDVPADSHVVMYDRHDRELARATAAPWKLPLNTADLGPQYHSVRVSVIDRAGNQTDYYRFFDIDLTAPVASVESMVPGYVGPGVQILLGTADDESGVDRIEWWIDGAMRGRYLDQLNYDFGTRERSTTVELRVWDRAGNRSITRYPVKIDAQGPTLVSSSPAANTRVRGTSVKATLQLADPSGVSTTMADGGLDLRVAAPWTATFRLGTDGRQDLVWLVSDVWGNQRKITQTVVVDNTGPSVSWLAPANNALVRGTRIPSSVKATDGAGIRSATLAGAAADGTAPYAASIAAGRDGRRTLTWTVLDRLGNRTVVKRTVIVDNTGPSLSVKAPKNKAKVKGTVKVTAAASDRNGVARVELLVNGKVVAKDTRAAYKFSVNTKKYGKKIKIQLRAYDRAGNLTKSATRTWYRR